MDATSMPSNTSLITNLKKLHPSLKFEVAHSFYWSPQKSTIFYEEEKLDNDSGEWALLHEVAHALLDHKTYHNDVGLLLCEVAAWQQAKELARDFEIEIDNEHIEDCLDTYRDWLYARSTCPTCSLNALQISSRLYKCFNCSSEWQVSSSRFCRPYRMQSRHEKTSPRINLATFQ